MLDYFGSVEKTDDEITRDLISRFRDYNQLYIEKIINDLAENKF